VQTAQPLRQLPPTAYAHRRPFIADTACAAVPHLHLVLTVPCIIRTLFLRDCSLLDHLYHAAHFAITA
jgi:hypothetical protein